MKRNERRHSQVSRLVALLVASILLISVMPMSALAETAHPDEWDIVANGCFRSSRPDDVDAIPTGFKTSKNHLMIRLDQDSGSLDPLNGGLYVPPSAIFNLCGTSLLSAGYVDGGVDFLTTEYSLADSMVWDDDMQGVTFHIRENAFFHNGDPVTAADAAFSVRRFSENVRFSYVDFANIQEIDEKTLYIPLTRSDGNFLFMMTIFCRIFSERLYNEAIATNREADFFYSSEGTCGMYTITEWASGDHVSLKKDPNFFKPANIENVTFRFIADNTVAMMELETGGVDILYSPASPDIANVLRGSYNGTISGIEDNGDVMTILGFNCAGKLADINLRYAVTHAVDWKTVVKAAWGVQGSFPSTFLASTLYGLNDVSDWWEGMYDVDAAKECLANSAYKDGVALKLIITNSASVVAASEMIARYLREVGITLSIETYDAPTQGSMMDTTSGWDMWIRDFGGYSMTWGSNFIKGGTYQKICHYDITEPENAEALYELGNRLSSTLDREEFKSIANQIEQGYLDGTYFYFFPITQVKISALCTSELHNWYRVKDNLYIADAYFE